MFIAQHSRQIKLKMVRRKEGAKKERGRVKEGYRKGDRGEHDRMEADRRLGQEDNCISLIILSKT